MATPGATSGNQVPSNQFVWADRDGHIVPGVVSDTFTGNSIALYFDANGHIWKIDTEALIITAAAGLALPRTFATKDCSGDAHYEVVNLGGVIPPRITLEHRLRRTFHVRNDDSVVKRTLVCSRDEYDHASCVSNGECLETYTVLESETTAVELPVVTAAPPLHPVFVP